MQVSLKDKWEGLIKKLSKDFSDGEEIGVEGILFLIGVQELGHGYKNFEKSEKQDIMHIAICAILEPYGYYEVEGIDEEGWPHFKATEKLPSLKAGEQSRLIKEAIVNYFEIR